MSSGIDVHKFSSMEQAEKQVANYNALTDFDNDNDFDNQHSDQPSDNTKSVRKQLKFATDDDNIPTKSSTATPINADDENSLDFEAAINAVDDTKPS